MKPTAGTTTAATAKPWWERIADAGGDKANSKRLLNLAATLALVVVAGILGWNWFRSSKDEAQGRLADKISEGRSLLPPSFLRGAYTSIQEAGFHYARKSYENYARSQRSSLMNDPKANAEYVKEVENAIAQLQDGEKEISGSDQACLYWSTLQQLHFYAALNSLDVAARQKHLDEQKAILEKMKSSYSNHPFVRLEPDVKKPGVNLVDYWLSINAEERSFAGQLPSALTPDESLEGSIVLANDKTLKVKFFSRVAPKSVAAFKMLADAGFYDGTAVFKVDATTKTLTAGDPFSRLAPERQRIWHKGDPGFTIAREVSAALPPKRGFISWERAGAQSHGCHFVIHLGEFEGQNYQDSVFAEITDGLDGLDELLATEVIADEKAENKFLPKVPLLIKTVRVEGTIQHPSDDSWRPEIKIPELPEKTAEEIRLDEEARAATQPSEGTPSSQPSEEKN